MKDILITIFCLTTLSSFAQQEIKIDDAKNHVGDSVKICTKIYGGKYLENSKGTPTFLNAGGYFPNAPLTIVIGQMQEKSLIILRKNFIKARKYV